MEKAQVLIVEDDGIIAMDIESQLKQLGYGVTAIVGYGEEALAKVKEHKPDLVLMDIVLKGEIDGIEAAAEIRTQYDIPVIFLTAFVDKERLKRAKLTYPFGFILKPFQPKDLEVTIEMALYVLKVDAERKQAEEGLKKSEEKYRTLFEVESDALFLVDEDTGNLLEANEAACKLYGYSHEELVGLKAWNLSAEPEKTEKAIKLVEKTFLPLRYHKKKDGTVFPVEINANHFTLDGRKINLSAIRDITVRKQAEEALRKRTKDLELKRKSLEELNTAMKVLLKKREEDKTELEENVMTNVKELIEPYFDKINKTTLDDHQKAFLNILESNLSEIISPFTRKLSLKYLSLTPQEIKIVNMVKIGYITKKIAKIMKISPRTVDTHRKNIRSKIGLGKKKGSLRSHLLAYEQ
ncbi:MAG: PAS domain S-box protein [Candidatus Desulfatibia sp.]|uniref:PAS domain S-box protein n=1 Tax=Candidatus Desulfatibia sp. TaxID=3101189 RepID=UPI002F32A6DC